MPASDYPELQGMPSGCMDTEPWQIDVVEVRVPYEDVDDVAIYQEPLISIDWPVERYEMFADEMAYRLDAPGISLGYQTPDEVEVLEYLRATAAATRNNTAFYHPEIKDTIVELAGEAWDLFSENRRIYETYEDEIEFTLPAGRGGTANFPLAMDDEEVIEITGSIEGIQARKNARDQIRANYLKGLYLLWCAIFGVSSSLSFRENRKLYLEREQLPEWAPGEEEDLPGWGEEPPGGVTPRPGQTPGGVTPRPGQTPGGGVAPRPGQTPGEEPGGYPGEEPFPPPPPTSPKKKKGFGGGILVAAVAGLFLFGRRR